MDKIILAIINFILCYCSGYLICHGHIMTGILCAVIVFSVFTYLTFIEDKL